MITNPINLTPDNFEAEVLKSDKPTAVIVLQIQDYDKRNINHALEHYEITAANFKSELQNIASDQYKIGLITLEYARELKVNTIVPLVYPPPIPFSIFINGDVIDTGFLLGLKGNYYNPLKDSLTNVATTFPQGDFRIINMQTGDALYVKLGEMRTISYFRLGNETTYGVSDKPTIGVRKASGGAEEAFYFDTSEDRGERQPRFQLVSVVVNRTNLGEHCVSRNRKEVYMYGCGTSRAEWNDWRWQTAGGYIWAADNEYGNQNKSYLTLTNGSLTLESKGQPGQLWRFEAPK
jgi:hypothetical protein